MCKRVPEMLRKGSCCIPSPAPSGMALPNPGNFKLLSPAVGHTGSVLGPCISAALASFVCFAVFVLMSSFHFEVFLSSCVLSQVRI